MNHTTRLERGLGRRASNTEHWRAARAGRDVRPRPQSQAAALAERITMAGFAVSYSALAQVYDGIAPKIAEALNEAGGRLTAGDALDPAMSRDPPLSADEAKAVAQVDAIGRRGIDALRRAEAQADGLQGDAPREAAGEKLAAARGRMAPLRPDRPELAAYARPGGDAAARHGALARALARRTPAAHALRETAGALGLNPPEIVARGPHAEEATAGQVADWTARDLGAIERSRSIERPPLPS